MTLIDSVEVNGPAKGILQLARSAKSSEWNVIVGNFDYGRAKSSFLQRAAAENIDHFSLPQCFSLDPSPVWQAVRTARRYRARIIQTHGYKSHVAGLAVSKLTGIPWLAVEHGWTYQDMKVRLYNALDYQLLRLPDTVVTVSEPLLRTVARLRRGRRTALIYNAVDQDELSRLGLAGEIRRRAGAERSDSILIGCFGRLSAEKNQAALIRAAVAIKECCGCPRVLFVGDGPDSIKLRRLAQELGVADRVHFEGQRTNMADYYEAIDLLVLPSLSEGLPNVVLEAMSFGKPVIATDVGSVSSVISNETTGWIVQNRPDSDSLSSTIAAAIQSGKLAQVGRAGKASIYPKFSTARRFERFSGVYNDLLAGLQQVRSRGVAAG